MKRFCYNGKWVIDVFKKIDLENRRKELGLTLEEVGNYVGVSKSTVKKWETGSIDNMKRDKIALLAQILQVSPLTILGIEEKPDEAGLDENIIIYHRNGKIIKKKMSKEKMELLSSMLDALPDDDNPDL